MARRALVPALALLVAACGEGGAVRQVVLVVDRAACTPACGVDHYSIWVHRALASGTRCALAERQVGGLGPEAFGALEAAAGSTVYAGAAAWCPAEAKAPSTCCTELAACLAGKVDKTNASCTKAAATCPAEGDPFGATAKDYYANSCATSVAGDPCVVCLGERKLSLAGDDEQVLSLTGVSGCKATPPAASPCP